MIDSDTFLRDKRGLFTDTYLWQTTVTRWQMWRCLPPGKLRGSVDWKGEICNVWFLCGNMYSMSKNMPYGIKTCGSVIDSDFLDKVLIAKYRETLGRCLLFTPGIREGSVDWNGGILPGFF